jgi:hypothetical protein
VREAVGVVDILIARETAEHRLAQQAGQQVARVPAATAFRQCRTRQIGQPERVVQFAIGKKTSVRGDATAMEFPLQAAVEIHPEGPVIRFTCWVFHPRASNPTITC